MFDSVFKSILALSISWYITLTDVVDVLKLVSLILTICYTTYLFTKSVKRGKQNNKNK